MPKIGQTGFGYADVAYVTNDTSNKLNTSHSHARRGYFDLDNTETLVRYCLRFGRHEFLRRAIASLAEAQKIRADRDFSIANTEHRLEAVVLSAIINASPSQLGTYERVLVKDSAELLVFTDGQRDKSQSARKSNSH